jgi:hypothetical protein
VGRLRNGAVCPWAPFLTPERQLIWGYFAPAELLTHSFANGNDGAATVSNHRRMHMDHIKLVLLGVIGIAVVIAVTAALTHLMGIARP